MPAASGPTGTTLMLNALFISRCIPSESGYGTARRGVTLLKALAKHYRLSLLLGPELRTDMCSFREKIPVPLENVRIGGNPPEGPPPASLKEYQENLRATYQTDSFDLIFVFRMGSLLLADHLLNRKCRYVLDLDELDSLSKFRIADLLEQMGRFREAAVERRQGKLMRVLECQKLPRFHSIFVSSAVEQAHVSRLGFGPSCAVVPNNYPAIVPLPRRPASRPFVFLFIGALLYPPNEDGVLFFALDVFQRLRHLTSEPVVFHVAGIGNNPRLDCLRYVEGVTMLGYVPDVRPAYEKADVAVVPLRAGAGTRIKILEAFAHETPVLSTTLGAEGLDVQDNRELLLRDGAASLAQSCVELIRDAGLRDRLARAGREFYMKNHQEEVILNRLNDLVSP
jgi:glycosyltransferase involved in cell wall biosynthesis